MQFETKNLFKNNGVYVIIERNPDDFMNDHVRVIGITFSYDEAVKHSGPNRFIQGPVSILEHNLPSPTHITYPLFKKDHEHTYNPPNLFDKNPFEPVRHSETSPFTKTNPIDINHFFKKGSKPYYDYSMLTPPSSRVNSNASSPVSETYL